MNTADARSTPVLTDELVGRIEQLFGRLDRIESVLVTLVRQRPVKEWYSIAELAEIIDKADFTVREYCRLGRLHAKKRACGRGRTRDWCVSHQELVRYQNEGLLPIPQAERLR